MRIQLSLQRIVLGILFLHGCLGVSMIACGDPVEIPVPTQSDIAISSPAMQAYTQALRATITDPDPAFRSLAVSKFADYRVYNTVDLITDLLLHDPDADVRCDAAVALNKLATHRAPYPALCAALRDVDFKVRIHSAQALGRCGDASTVAPLIAALNDPNADVRLFVVQALGLIGDPQAVPPVTQALQDPDASVRDTARSALGRLAYVGGIPALVDQMNTIAPAGYEQLISAFPMIRDRRLENALLTLLSDPTPAIRLEVLLHLQSICTANSRHSVEACLQDQDAEIRGTALHTLSFIGDWRAAPMVIPMLHDPDPHVRREAAQDLAKFLVPEAVEPLWGAINDPDPAVRYAVVRALLSHKATPRLTVLQPLIHDADSSVGSTVIEFLGTSTDPQAQLLIQQARQDPSPALRASAYRNLEQQAQKDDTLLPQLLEGAHDPAPDVRDTAITALGQVGGPWVIQQLIALLREPDTQQSAAYALKLCGDRTAVQSLIGILSSPDEMTRATVVSALGSIGDREAADALLPFLTDPSPAMRRIAAYALARLDDHRAIAPIIKLMEDPAQMAEMRGTAAKSLGLFSGDTAVPFLLKATYDTAGLVRKLAIGSLATRTTTEIITRTQELTLDTDPEVRAAVLEIMVNRRDPGTLECLISALDDPIIVVRRAAAAGIAELGDAQAVPALLALVPQEFDPEIRASVARTLARTGQRQQIPLLLDFLEDPNPEPRTEAFEALKAITGQDLGDTPERWRTWWATQPHNP